MILKSNTINFKNIIWTPDNSMSSIKKIKNIDNKQLKNMNKEKIRVKISEAGKKLYAYQRDSKNPKIFDNELKLLKAAIDKPSTAYKKYIEDTIYGKAIDYRKGIDKINEMEISKEDKLQRKDILKNQFENTINSASKRLSRILDGYFDAGTKILNQYSDTPVEELFNKDVFKNHIKFLSFTAKKIANNSNEMMDKKKLKQVMKKYIPSSNTIEKMSSDDLKEIIGFIYQKNDMPAFHLKGNKGVGEGIANQERKRIEYIGRLNISSSTKKVMLKSEKRKSMGMLRHYAYTEEIDQTYYKMKEYNKQLKLIFKRLKKLKERIDVIQENLEISTENNLLLNLLKSEKKTQKKYKNIKKKKSQLIKKTEDLKKDKSKIVDKEIYIKYKMNYDKKMNDQGFNKRVVSIR